MFPCLFQDDRTELRTQVFPLPALTFTHYFTQHLIFTGNLFVPLKHFANYRDSKDEMKSEVVVSEPEAQHAAFTLVLNS